MSLNGSVGAIIIASLQVASACDPSETKGAPDVRFVKTTVCQAQTIFYNDDGSLWAIHCDFWLDPVAQLVEKDSQCMELEARLGSSSRIIVA